MKTVTTTKVTHYEIQKQRRESARIETRERQDREEQRERGDDAGREGDRLELPPPRQPG